jgi:hypothetical protein
MRDEPITLYRERCPLLKEDCEKCYYFWEEECLIEEDTMAKKKPKGGCK